MNQSRVHARSCDCREEHERRKVVLTGGPGAGKTAVLELIRQSLCPHVRIVPEAAGIVFGGGFPRGGDIRIRRAGQRAIFYVQRELEAAADAGNPAVVLCDRGTVDGLAYWPGPDDLWSAVGTTLDDELRRYDVTIHLRTPSAETGYNHANPLRTESPAEAQVIDERIAVAWAGHPRRFLVESSEEFLGKVARVLELMRQVVPPCCRGHFAVPGEGHGPDTFPGPSAGVT